MSIYFEINRYPNKYIVKAIENDAEKREFKEIIKNGYIGNIIIGKIYNDEMIDEVFKQSYDFINLRTNWNEITFIIKHTFDTTNVKSESIIGILHVKKINNKIEYYLAMKYNSNPNNLDLRYNLLTSKLLSICFDTNKCDIVETHLLKTDEQRDDLEILRLFLLLKGFHRKEDEDNNFTGWKESVCSYQMTKKQYDEIKKLRHYSINYCLEL